MLMSAVTLLTDTHIECSACGEENQYSEAVSRVCLKNDDMDA